MKTASLLITARSRSQRHPAAFTLIELLVVIAVMGILAGFLVGLAPAAGAKMRESRVRAELDSIITAIEAYKNKYGFYPPDGYFDATGKIVDPAINPLFYELTGVQVINPKSATLGEFRTAVGGSLKPDVVLKVFGRDGFVNAGQDRRRLHSTTFRAGQHASHHAHRHHPRHHAREHGQGAARRAGRRHRRADLRRGERARHADAHPDP